MSKPNKHNKALNQADKIFHNSTGYEASTNDERLQRMLNKNAELEDQLSSVNNTDEYLDIAEKLALHEESTYDYSLQVDSNLTNKAKKVYAKAFQTQGRVSNTSRRAISAAGRQEYRSLARGNSDVYLPTEELERRYEMATNRSSEINERASISIGALKPGDDTDHIRKMGLASASADREAAKWLAIKHEQNRLGLSSSKLSNKSDSLVDSYDKYMGVKRLEDDVRSGKYGNLKEEEQKWGSSQLNLKDANANLSMAQAAGVTGKALKELSEAVVKATKATEEQEKVVKKVRELEEGGGSGYSKAAAYMGAFANVARAGMTIAVDHDTQETVARTAFANTGNRLWDKSKEAVQGYSVDAAEEILGSQRAMAEASRTKDNARIIKPIGDYAGHAAEALSLVGGKTVFLEQGAAAAQGVNIASGVAIDASDTLKGLTVAKATMTEHSARLGLNEAERHMRVSQEQDFMNHGMNTYTRTRGMGSASDIQDTLMNTSNISKYAGLGVSAAEAAASGGILAQAGVMERGGADKIIMGSGAAARRGQMGQEEYVSAAARMVSAGGSASDLESIISAATTKGMDNSKNIGQMVDATLSLSSGLAAQGIGGTGVVSNMLGASTQNLVDAGYDKNLAIGKAARGIEAFDAAATDKRLSFGSIVEQQAIRGIGSFKNATIGQIEQTQELTSAEMAVIKKGGAKGHLLARERGLESRFYKADGSLDENAWESVRDIKINKVLQTGAKGSIMYSKDIMNKLKSGQAFSEEERASIRNQAGLTEDALRSQYKGDAPVNSKATEKTDGAFDIKKGAADQMARNIAVGEKVAGGMTGLAKVMQAVVDTIKPETFGKTIQDAAKDFLPASANVLEATKNLDATVKRLIQLQEGGLGAMGKNVSLKGDLPGTIPTKPKKSADTRGERRGDFGDML